MRTQAHGIHLPGALVFDVRRQEVFSEDIASEQKFVVAFQSVKGLVERQGMEGIFANSSGPRS